MSVAHDWAQAMHERGHRATLADLLLRGPWSFFRAYVLQRGFLDGFYGFVIAASAGFYTFVKYAMLRELKCHKTGARVNLPADSEVVALLFRRVGDSLMATPALRALTRGRAADCGNCRTAGRARLRGQSVGINRTVDRGTVGAALAAVMRRRRPQVASTFFPIRAARTPAR